MNQMEKIAQQIYESNVPVADKQIAAELRVLLGSLSLAIVNNSNSAYEFQKYAKRLESIIAECLREAFVEAFDKSGVSFNLPINKDALERAAKMSVNEPWLGRTFKNSIQNNVSGTYQRFVDLVANGIANGKDHKKLIEETTKLLEISFNDAKRLVRTETMYQINQAQKKVYMDAGYVKYEFMATLDSRTSEVCRDNDKKEFYFADAVVGINYPPLHPNCRSTVIPVVLKK